MGLTERRDQMALNREQRKKLRAYIKSGNCPKHMMPIYRWQLQRRSAQICPEPIPTIWFLLGGRGCIAEGTPVWDPSVSEYRPIEQMIKPSWVLSTAGPIL